MSEDRFLIVRLSSMGDVISALPVLAALRDTFLRAQIDWVIDRRWQPLLMGNPDLNEVIPLRSRSIREFFQCGSRLRIQKYKCVVDAQGLYKSALLAKLTGAPSRVGFSFSFAREHASTMFYTQRVKPVTQHIIDQNLELAFEAGATRHATRFPLYIPSDAQSNVDQFLRSTRIEKFVVLSPGGGWISKCWPPERYGELSERLRKAYGYRIIINSGPGEAELAEAAVANAGLSLPIIVQYELPELMALLSRADMVVAGDSGPLHLAVALDTPVVGLYGPTSPARNGPYGGRDTVVRNAKEEDTTHKREDSFSDAMMSISVDQVMAAVKARLARPMRNSPSRTPAAKSEPQTEPAETPGQDEKVQEKNWSPAE
ncbi:MAG TPA: glycosyltransferase family 9 protein [Candidatus Acidoferrales bacterium]|nr:glycosyltransferase family 9 protein [Candidatus Acidoferrales bacterium]